MSPHKTTGVTPNFAMLGREVLLPSTLMAKPPEEPMPISVPYAQNIGTTCVLLTPKCAKLYRVLLRPRRHILINW